MIISKEPKISHKDKIKFFVNFKSLIISIFFFFKEYYKKFRKDKKNKNRELIKKKNINKI